MKLAAAFGLPVTKAEICSFGATKALVVERFDRRWTKDGRLLRLPQEDFCQALSVLPSRRYQNMGGPGLVRMLDLLGGSDNLSEDRATLFKAKILFWLIGATDGHAKNFSVFLGSGGNYRLTPLYDILTAQPSLDARQIERKQMTLAMSVGDHRHYRIGEVAGRHFIQTGKEAGLPPSLIRDATDEMADKAESALAETETALPADFPNSIPIAVRSGLIPRLRRLRVP